MPRASIPPEYENLGLLGEGGFGSVYKVMRKSDGMTIALKVIDIDSMPPNSQEVLRNETELFSLLEHRNLVKCYATFQDRTTREQYIAMELCERSLRDYIKEHRQTGSMLPEKTIWSLLYQILQGVSYLHSRHKPNDARLKCIIHRDLKPENILLTKDLSVKICDFGIARPLGLVSQAQTIAGTGPYMAPEIIQNQSYTEKVDVWSIGCIAYEICNLKTPQFSKLYSAGKITTDDPTFIIPDIYSDNLRDFISRCLVTSPEERYSAYELLTLPEIQTIVQQSRSDIKDVESEDMSSSNTQNQNASQPMPSFSWNALGPSESKNNNAIPVQPSIPEKKVIKTPIILPGSAEEKPRLISKYTKREVYFDRKQNTNLMIAVMSGASIQTIQANLHLCKFRNKLGETALHMAVEQQSLEYVELLAPHEATIRLREASFLLPPNTGLKIKKFYNISALMLASMYGLSKIVKVLRAYELGLQSAEGYTALMFAILTGSSGCAALLLNEATRMTDRGETALMFAARMGNADLVDKLLPYEAKVVSGNGTTALMEACKAGHMILIKKLLPYEGHQALYTLKVNLVGMTKGITKKHEVKQLIQKLLKS